MKKIIGFIGSYICYYIGNWACKVSYTKYKGDFFFEKNKFLFRIGYGLAGIYQKFMHYSTTLQDWGGAGCWKYIDKYKNAVK